MLQQQPLVQLDPELQEGGALSTCLKIVYNLSTCAKIIYNCQFFKVYEELSASRDMSIYDKVFFEIVLYWVFSEKIFHNI